MNNQLVKESIATIVNTRKCVRFGELTLAVMHIVGPTNFEFDTFEFLLNEFITKGEMIKLNYCIKTGEKDSIIFPKETIFTMEII